MRSKEPNTLAHAMNHKFALNKCSSRCGKGNRQFPPAFKSPKDGQSESKVRKICTKIHSTYPPPLQMGMHPMNCSSSQHWTGMTIWDKVNKRHLIEADNVFLMFFCCFCCCCLCTIGRGWIHLHASNTRDWMWPDTAALGVCLNHCPSELQPPPRGGQGHRAPSSGS